jgi:UDPglucose--hexose-1-phosphate uridylyltransferase
MARLLRTELRQPDGRRVYLYGAFDEAPAGYRSLDVAGGEYQRRWSPLRREWILVAAGRKSRTFLPDTADCPLCPSRPGHSTEIPASW